MSSESSSLDAASNSASSLWDRITTWASENKAVAYTIAGTVVVVTGAGAVYYYSSPKRHGTQIPEKKKSKKERRLEKQKAKEDEEKAGISLKDEEAG